LITALLQTEARLVLVTALLQPEALLVLFVLSLLTRAPPHTSVLDSSLQTRAPPHTSRRLALAERHTPSKRNASWSSPLLLNRLAATDFVVTDITTFFVVTDVTTVHQYDRFESVHTLSRSGHTPSNRNAYLLVRLTLCELFHFF
jgi:hypothetical protein